jgi:hypothetical protein
MANLAAAAVLIAFVASGGMVSAQLPAPTPIQTAPQPTRPVQQPAQTSNLNAAKPSPMGPPTSAAQSPAPEPPKPDWPVNDKPVPAKVTWDVHGLSVEANNSSLDEILKIVSTLTGAKVDGKVGEERIFGSYGPGTARDVVSQLLDGTPYNVMMVGDLGEGTPRQIVLSNRPAGPAPVNNAQNNNEEETEYEPPPQQMPGSPIMRNAFPAPGMPPEQNQQMMEERRAEMEQRQEQMRQQQEQQQPQQPQQPQVPPQ